MSSRTYRKYLKAKEEQEKNNKLDEGSESLSEEENVTTRSEYRLKPQRNAFSALQNEEGEVEEEESDFDFEIPSLSKPSSKTKSKESKSSDLEHYLHLSPSSNEQKDSPLALDSKLLNHYNELERLFGKSVVKRPSKRLIFCDVNPTWLRMPKTFLQMDYTNDVFYFNHPPAYQIIQKRFFELVEFNDPQILGEFQKINPFHVDTLLVLAELCKTSREYSSARDLIERALYAFERSFHSKFISQAILGLAHLPYSHFENRAFYLVIYKHIQFVIRKGAWGSAFEMAKFLLYLDFDTDPIGMLYLIDFLALRCNNYQFVVDFYLKYSTSKQLTVFPNWNYSYSLACFYLNRIEESQLYLANSIMKFPTQFARLNSKCGWRLKVPQISLSIQETFFDVDSEFWNESERILSSMEKLYTERTCLCWKEEGLLLQWISGVLESLDLSSTKWKEYLDDRKCNYNISQLNYFRHLMASDMDDSRIYIPSEIMAHSTRVYDLLPPTDTSGSYVDEFLTDQSTSQLERSESGRFNISSLISSFFRTSLSRDTNNSDILPRN